MVIGIERVREDVSELNKLKGIRIPSGSGRIVLRILFLESYIFLAFKEEEEPFPTTKRIICFAT